MWYPNIEDAEEANKYAIKHYRATKAESFGVNHIKLNNAIKESKEGKGSVEEKAAHILKSFSDNHPFASANRRTAYLIMNKFFWKNKGFMIAKKKEFTSHLFKELRRRDVPKKEILAWYKHTKRFVGAI